MLIMKIVEDMKFSNFWARNCTATYIRYFKVQDMSIKLERVLLLSVKLEKTL